eukprot:TRINITY_DN21022_c0_g1_i3.p1 TRINITY_DN21022_c0_g1~~TRINITY_DN21022_c0_g1_i3.p1  ORF type:complete len:362 (-),score=24.59 TRINITY_DN21022_c0_g1_i3:159-1085(-)
MSMSACPTKTLVGAKAGHLSSYSLTLMALYYLQIAEDLPVLPTTPFAELKLAPVETQAEWRTSKHLSELLHGFFNFYDSEFSWGKEVVAVRLGSRTNRNEPCHADLRGIKYNRLHIEDPFLLDRNLNCVLGQDQENMLYGRIEEAALRMTAGQLPPGLDYDPVAVTIMQQSDLRRQAAFQAASPPMQPKPGMQQTALQVYDSRAVLAARNGENVPDHSIGSPGNALAARFPDHGYGNGAGPERPQDVSWAHRPDVQQSASGINGSSPGMSNRMDSRWAEEEFSVDRARAEAPAPEDVPITALQGAWSL